MDELFVRNESLDRQKHVVQPSEISNVNKRPRLSIIPGLFETFYGITEGLTWHLEFSLDGVPSKGPFIFPSMSALRHPLHSLVIRSPTSK